MRPGTEVIIGQLKRQKALKLNKEQWADLIDDVMELGKDAFIASIMPPAEEARPAPRSKKPVDPLTEKFERYRKKTGLKAVDFIKILHSRLGANLPSPPVKGALSSAPKYLAHLKQCLSETEIEAGLADVTNEYA